jgi:predicted nucleotidyltransferase
VDDERFLEVVADRASEIPGVVAVALGGSRAQGRHRSDSDWDLAIYYRGHLDVQDVRDTGWEGVVYAPGDWGRGVMNGGAFLRIDGRPVDLHYRDLDDVEHWCALADAGHFEVQRLPFYLAGVPTYLVAAELPVNRVLVGTLPRPGFPRLLRRAAPEWWHEAALLSVGHAESSYAAVGDPLGCVGELARAVLEEAHARLAAAGRWVLNEKRMVSDAGLDRVRPVFACIGHTDAELAEAADVVRAVITGQSSART